MKLSAGGIRWKYLKAAAMKLIDDGKLSTKKDRDGILRVETDELDRIEVSLKKFL